MEIDAEQQPDLRAEYGKRTFRLIADYKYVVAGTPKDKLPPRIIVVPADFACDGASIPRWLWSIVGVRLGGRIRAAALVHDYAYYWNGDYEKCTCGVNTRGAVDKLFRRIMRQAGMERRRVFMCYWAVRLFGWRAWRKHKRRIASEKRSAADVK